MRSVHRDALNARSTRNAASKERFRIDLRNVPDPAQIGEGDGAGGAAPANGRTFALDSPITAQRGIDDPDNSAGRAQSC